MPDQHATSTKLLTWLMTLLIRRIIVDIKRRCAAQGHTRTAFTSFKSFKSSSLPRCSAATQRRATPRWLALPAILASGVA